MLLRPEQVFGIFSGGPQIHVPDWDDFANGGNGASGAAAIANTSVFGRLNWRCATNLGGTVTNVTTDQDANTHGVVELATTGNAASAAGFARFASGVPTRIVGAGQRFRHMWRVRNIPQLSDGTNRFAFRVGFANSPAVTPTDGLYFEYSDNVNSGRWRGVAMKAGAPTNVDGGAPFAVAINTPYLLEVRWNSVLVEWLVNNVSIGTTAAANVPVAAVGEVASHLVSVGTGTTRSRLDFFWQDYQWGGGR